MRDKLIKLIDVKSIITLMIVITYLAMALLGKVDVGTFETIVLMVITFYFGTQYQKKVGDKYEGND